MDSGSLGVTLGKEGATKGEDDSGVVVYFKINESTWLTVGVDGYGGRTSWRVLLLWNLSLILQNSLIYH